MRKKEEFSVTTHHHVYEKLYRVLNKDIGCPFCTPHRGCNRRWGITRRSGRSWKNYRDRQYKVREKGNEEIQGISDQLN